MKTARFFLFDIKRIFSRPSLIALCLLSPLAVILIFSMVVSPMLYTGRGISFNVALCNEDKSAEVKDFINQLVNSHALAELVSVYPVDTVEKGIQLAEGGKVSVLVHVPKGIFSEIRAGRASKATVYGTPAHALETELISMTLGSSLTLVGKGQNIMETAKSLLLEKGFSQEESEEFLKSSTSAAVKVYMDRRELLGRSGPLSPLGEYLPVEYYMSAIFSVFAALSMLPLIQFTAADTRGAVLRRGLFGGVGPGGFFAARLFSGALFIFLVLSMLFPGSILLRLSGELLGGRYGSSLAALLVSMALTALVFSALAFAVAVWAPGKKAALWLGFFLSVCMAALCGALIPESALPAAAAAAGKWLPLRPAMRMLSASLFNYRQGDFLKDAAKGLGFLALLLPLCLLGAKKRRRPA